MQRIWRIFEDLIPSRSAGLRRNVRSRRSALGLCGKRRRAWERDIRFCPPDPLNPRSILSQQQKNAGPDDRAEDDDGDECRFLRLVAEGIHADERTDETADQRDAV